MLTQVFKDVRYCHTKRMPGRHFQATFCYKEKDVIQGFFWYENYKYFKTSFCAMWLVSTVASDTLEGMFLVNNSPNTQHRTSKPSALDFY